MAGMNCRGIINIDDSSQLMFMPAPSHVVREQNVRQCLPPSDGLIILHGIRERRMVDLKASQPVVSGKGQRKRTTVSSRGDQVPSNKRPRTSSTPNGLDSSGAPQPSSSRGGTISYGRVVFTFDALGSKTLPDLKDICRSRGLSVGGKKDKLVQRILTSQAGPYASGVEAP